MMKVNTIQPENSAVAEHAWEKYPGGDISVVCESLEQLETWQL